MKTQDRLSAVDLNDLTEAQLRVLRQDAIRRKLPFSKYLAVIADEAATAMLKASGRNKQPA